MSQESFTSVEDMVRSITDDEEILGAVDEAIERQAVMSRLMAMRAVRGLSQQDVAEAMGCSQPSVSKMENSADEELKFGELQRYAKAVRCELSAAVIPEDMEPAEEVKYLAFAVRDRLYKLVELAKKNESITVGVTRFFFEVFVNISSFVSEAASSLPKREGEISLDDLFAEDIRDENRKKPKKHTRRTKRTRRMKRKRNDPETAGTAGR